MVLKASFQKAGGCLIPVIARIWRIDESDDITRSYLCARRVPCSCVRVCARRGRVVTKPVG